MTYKANLDSIFIAIRKSLIFSSLSTFVHKCLLAHVQGSALPQFSAVLMDGLNKYGDRVRRRKLGDAVAEVEHMTVFCARLAEGVERTLHFRTDLLGLGE